MLSKITTVSESFWVLRLPRWLCRLLDRRERLALRRGESR